MASNGKKRKYVPIPKENLNDPRIRVVHIKWENLPEFLKGPAIRYVGVFLKPSTEPGKKPIKQPVGMDPGIKKSSGKFWPRRIKASSTDPATQYTYEQIRKLWALNLKWIESGNEPIWHGVGVVLERSTGMVGIDRDNCIDAAGAIAPEQDAMRLQLNTYTEVSQSGRGFKMIALGDIPVDGKKDGSTIAEGFEAYKHGRYFMLTGDIIPGTSAQVESRPAEVMAAFEFVYPNWRDEKSTKEKQAARATERFELAVATGSALPEDQVLQKALAARNGHAIRLLYQGDLSAYDGDESEADYALAGYLGFYSPGNPGAVESLMRQSGLYRPKYDEPRGNGTYISMTVGNAMASMSTFYGDNTGNYADPEFAAITAAAAGLTITFTNTRTKCPRCREVGPVGKPCACAAKQEQQAARAATLAAERNERRAQHAKQVATTATARIVANAAKSLAAIENEFSGLLAAEADDPGVIEAAPANFSPSSHQLKFECGVSVYMRGIAIAKDIILEPRCRCWGCLQCNIQNKRDRCACIELRIYQSKCDTFYCATIPMADWKRIYERIKEHRRRAYNDGTDAPINYIRIEQLGTDDGDVYKVVCEAPVFAGFATAFTAFTKKQAIAFATGAINLIPLDTYNREPISTSHPWNFSRPDPVNKYERIGIVPRMRVKRIREILAAGGIDNTRAAKPKHPKPGEEHRIISSLEIAIPMGRNHAELSRQIVDSLRADMWMPSEAEWEGIEFEFGHGGRSGSGVGGGSNGRERQRGNQEFAKWDCPDLVNA